MVASSTGSLRGVLGPNNPSVYFVKKIKNIQSWIKSINIAISDLIGKVPNEITKYSCLQSKKFTIEKND